MPLKSTDFFKSQELLLIVPHFKVFIHDQATLIEPYFKKMLVLMPIPYFSSVALKLPYMKRYFRFLKLALESKSELTHDSLLASRFFSLPVESMRKRNYYLAAKSCINSLSRNKTDFGLIHAHFVENGFIGTAIKGLFGKPLVVTAHGGDVWHLPFKDKWSRDLTRYVLHETDQIITVSQSNRDKLLSLGVSTKKLHVIPNGYNGRLFRPLSSFKARKSLGLPLSKKILISVGNLVDAKGHAYLIDAMRIVLKKQKDAILVIVGSGSLKEGLQKKTKALGLDDKIFFAGPKRHEEIPEWINAGDIFVLPSLNEGFPTVIPEALACGKPVVATDVGGVREALRSRDVGLLVEPKNVNSLACGILEGLRKEWYSEAICAYAERYAWNRLIPNIISVYEKALQR